MGWLGDGASVRVTYPAAMRSSSRIRCTHALMFVKYGLKSLLEASG
jgi:hypothetical protein